MASLVEEKAGFPAPLVTAAVMEALLESRGLAHFRNDTPRPLGPLHFVDVPYFSTGFRKNRNIVTIPDSISRYNRGR